MRNGGAPSGWWLRVVLAGTAALVLASAVSAARMPSSEGAVPRAASAPLRVLGGPPNRPIETNPAAGITHSLASTTAPAANSKAFPADDTNDSVPNPAGVQSKPGHRNLISSDSLHRITMRERSSSKWISGRGAGLSSTTP